MGRRPVPVVLSPLAQTLRSLRTAHTWTLADAAAVLAVDPSTVHNWEHGRSVPTLEQLQAIADAYGITLTALLAPKKSRKSGK